MPSTNEELVEYLADAGVLKSKDLKEAFRQVDRKDFVKPSDKGEAYEDHPLPIGAGGTISQPRTVAFMLELLNPLKGEKVLDVGSGSGWTTAILGRLVGIDGEVHGVELEPELVHYGRTNMEAYDTGNANIVQAGDELGLPKNAPYHRILVSASAKALPQDLMDQLANGGVMVIPIKDSIYKFTKRAEGNYESEEYPGFRFVPLKS